MPGYDFYSDAYGGWLDEAAYTGVEKRALAKLERVERQYTVCYPAPDCRDKALCAVAEQLWLTELAGGDGAALVKQVKAGSVSTTFDTQRKQALLADAGRRYYNAVCLHAEVYRGIAR